ncbi:putative tetratricopeptide-like helical domain superfamily [Helianthus anomalus]
MHLGIMHPCSSFISALHLYLITFGFAIENHQKIAPRLDLFSLLVLEFDPLTDYLPIAINLAKQAAEETDLSIALDPNDAASHVLKALALDAQGYTTPALTALDVALSPLTAKSLSDAERGEALFKRAEIKKVSCCKEERVDSVFEDLVESVKLYGENAEAFWMLGECYEKKG